MRLPLELHPDSIGTAVTGIAVNVTHPQPNQLLLAYSVSAAVRDLRIPPRVESGRADELWMHTCFEAFIRTSTDAGYYEFNFSPSTQWAAYEFTGYRSGMQIATTIQAPPIAMGFQPSSFTLSTRLELDQIKLARGEKWHLGLSAVIEEQNGRTSYWALTHPPGKPDFHCADCFMYEFS